MDTKDIIFNLIYFLRNYIFLKNLENDSDDRRCDDYNENTTTTTTNSIVFWYDNNNNNDLSTIKKIKSWKF